MCAPADVNVYACVVSGLLFGQSGTCAGPPHLKRCLPKIQLKVKKQRNKLHKYNNLFLAKKNHRGDVCIQVCNAYAQVSKTLSSQV